jgi:hypothetical protein
LNQALSSGSDVASASSCAMTEIMPSAADTLLGATPFPQLTMQPHGHCTDGSPCRRAERNNSAQDSVGPRALRPCVTCLHGEEWA